MALICVKTQQWLDKVGANWMLVAAQRLVLPIALPTPELRSTSTQCPLCLSWAAANTSSNQEMAHLRFTTADKDVGRTLIYNPQFLENQNQFRVASGDAKRFVSGGSQLLMWRWSSVSSANATDSLMLMNQFSGSSAATLEAFKAEPSLLLLIVAAPQCVSGDLWWPLFFPLLPCTGWSTSFSFCDNQHFHVLQTLSRSTKAVGSDNTASLLSALLQGFYCRFIIIFWLRFFFGGLADQRELCFIVLVQTKIFSSF